MSARSVRRSGTTAIARPRRLVVVLLFGLVIDGLAHAQQNGGTVSSIAGEIAEPAQIAQLPPESSPERAKQQDTFTATLRGRVTSRDTGRPLSGAEVTIFGPFGHREVTRPPELKSRTDADGRFVFERLRDGRYGVEVTSPGYVTTSFGQTIWSNSTTTLEVPEGQTVTQNFALFRGGAIGGRLVDASGEPIADARIVALGVEPMYHTRSPVAGGRSFPTNDIGEFRIAELLPGNYYLWATFNQARPLPRRGLRYVSTFYPGTPNVVGAKKVVVVAGRTHRGIVVTVPRIRAAQIKGTALNSRGQPLKGFLQLTAKNRQQEEWASLGSSQIQSDGSFTIGGVTPGDYTLSVAESSPVATREYVSLNMTVADADVTGVHIVSQQGPVISGRVTFPTSGQGALQPRALTVEIQPIKGRQVGAISSWTTLDDGWSFHLPAEPGSMRVLLSGLPASWRLKAVRYRGTDVTDRGFEAHLGNNIDDIELQLADHPSSVSGVVVDERGSPVNRAWALLLPRDGDKSALVRDVRFLNTSENGRFTFGGLPDGDYLAMAAITIPQAPAIEPGFLSIVEVRAQRFSLGPGEAKTLSRPLTAMEDTWRRPPGKWRFLMHLFGWIGHTLSTHTSTWAPTPRA
jgi:hypothetical protein